MVASAKPCRVPAWIGTTFTEARQEPVYQGGCRLLRVIRVPLIKGGRQTVSDPVLTAVTTGAHRLSTVDGPLWPGDRPAAASGRWADPTSFTARRVRAAGLSGRERDVLALLADGYATREIAERLCYSERTIKNVLHYVTSRLQLRNRTQAVAYAVRRGWI